MILSEHTIMERLDELVDDHESIDIDEQVQPASLDVRFGRELYDQHAGLDVGPWGDGQVKAHHHVLEPGVPYLGHTMERVTMPNDVAALLTGRSSTARRNIIVHQTAGWVDPGFEGQLTFEILNFGERNQRLRIGERVAQMIFFKLDRPVDGYDGKYQGQAGITPHQPDEEVRADD